MESLEEKSAVPLGMDASHHTMVGSLNLEEVEQLSMWESFLIFLWSFSVLAKKLLDIVSPWITESVQQTVTNEELVESESRDLLGIVRVVLSESVDETSPSSTRLDDSEFLLPPLLNDVVSWVVWHQLIVTANRAMVFRFGRINHQWRYFIRSTFEWQILQFMQVDRIGFQALIHALGLRQ